MSSILTNTSAMVALQTLKGINSNLAKTQDEISTGKTVASAKDNAAVWAITKVMESDVAGFEAISDSLSLGESTVSVARQAAESVQSKLTEMKNLIVSAQGENVDRAKLETDLNALRDSITKTVDAAQFNGLNMLKAGSDVNVLASLDRGSDGTVTASNIAVARKDLSGGDYTAKAVFTGSDGASTAADTFGQALDGAGGSMSIVIDNTTALVEGDSISVSIGGKTATYTVGADDVNTGTTTEDLVATGLKNAIQSLGIDGLDVVYDSASPGEITLTNNGTADISVSGQYKNSGAGELAGLNTISVSSTANAQAALGTIETLINNAVEVAAHFGSAEKQLSSQADFVSKLSDALTNGIGSMVDADMEEASARLQALQVQQQLGIQSLSIANGAPQNILSLFR